MGSKQALSNGNEPEELTGILRAFELHNSVLITVHSSLMQRNGRWDTIWVAIAVPLHSANMAAQYLGSASALCWGSEFKNLMGLFTSLLYKLDFQLAELEWGKVREQR